MKNVSGNKNDNGMRLRPNGKPNRRIKEEARRWQTAHVSGKKLLRRQGRIDAHMTGDYFMSVDGDQCNSNWCYCFTYYDGEKRRACAAPAPNSV
jgi:hypothetical protein